MLINVPQYIDIEDKIIGPITAKQLGWLIVMGIIMLVFWNTLPKMAFLAIAIPMALFFVAMAFLKPYGQPLPSFLSSGFRFLFKPKVYVWKRQAQKIEIPHSTRTIQMSQRDDHREKLKVLDNISEIARVLDSGGAQHNEAILEILKQNKKKK